MTLGLFFFFQNVMTSGQGNGNKTTNTLANYLFLNMSLFPVFLNELEHIPWKPIEIHN